MQTEQAVLGGGCFWCLEASYQLVKGVTKVVPGYAGGSTKDPSYMDVQSQSTGHAEVVQITFDVDVISYQDILDIFWAIHDPTTPNQQGNDIGEEYRSIILYANDQQKSTAESSKAETQKLWDKPIVTQIKPLQAFYEAEKEHHNYYQRHPERAYCQIVINPKLAKLQSKFATKLKKH